MLFEKGHLSFSILINNYQPLFCFKNVDLINIHDILSFVSVLGIFCTDDYLSKPLDNRHLHRLDKHEIEQVNYWKGSSIGEVVFKPRLCNRKSIPT
jgi:hypothetical protein